jgi:oligogalacturonide transporter
MALVFAVAYSLPWFLVFAGTWELTGERRPEERRTALEVFRRFGSIFRNRSFRVHIGMYIFAYSALDMLMALFVYFLNYYLGRPELYPVAMGSLLVTQLAAMPVYVRISNRR